VKEKEECERKRRMVFGVRVSDPLKAKSTFVIVYKIINIININKCCL